MAEIVLKIPEEFEQDFNTDRFKECFERVLFDCKAWDYAGISGNYEHETLKMLLDAFNEAVVLPKGHGRLIDAEGLDITTITTDDYSDNEVLDIVLKEDVDSATTIIEADKEEENESVS